MSSRLWCLSSSLLNYLPFLVVFCGSFDELYAIPSWQKTEICVVSLKEIPYLICFRNMLSLLNIFRREGLCVESAVRPRTVDTSSWKMSPKFKHSVLQMSLGTDECDFFFNATLASLVHSTQLHCIFSHVLSNFKWLEWWDFHLLPGQRNPMVPKIHKAFPVTARLQQTQERGGRAHKVLIAA